MPRFVRIGRWVVNVDLAPKVTGLEPEFILSAEDAEELRRQLGPMTRPWTPIVVGPHPRGPLKPDRPPYNG